jgi:serine/threonine protein kinase
VLEPLGQGGMGVVLAAYDARLDRRVALKLLHSRQDSEQGHARLVREAQAMARLSHPCVVAVYDAGTLEDGSVFIAMEYVQGRTLRRWCEEQPRTWREVLQAYESGGSPPPTPRASSTATSSRRTCWWGSMGACG